MKCPECGEEVPEGTTICEHCDYILDKSFLGDGYTDDIEHEDAEDFAPTENAPPPNPSRRMRPPRTAEPPPPAAYEEERAEKERRQRRAAQDTPVDSASAPSDSFSIEGSRIVEDVEGFLKKLGQAYKVLGTHDKLAVGGSLAMVLFSFFPWVAVPGFSLIGLERNGWFLLIVAAAMIGLVYVRHQDAWYDKERYVLYGQVGVSVLGLLFMLAEVSSTSQIQINVPNLREPVVGGGSIQMGLVFCFLASLVVVAGVLLLFREKVLKK